MQLQLKCTDNTGENIAEGTTILHISLQRKSSLACRKRMDKNYRGADKSLARPTSRCILFDG